MIYWTQECVSGESSIKDRDLEIISIKVSIYSWGIASLEEKRASDRTFETHLHQEVGCGRRDLRIDKRKEQ